MLYFAHGGIDDGHPDEPVTGTPDIHTPPLPQTTTTAPTGAESSPTSGPWLPLAGLTLGILIIAAAAIFIALKRRKPSN